MDIDRLKCYALARAQEASTWRGAVLLLTAAGTQIKPEMQELIVAAGIGIAGALGALFPDAKKKD
jgi:hypothetical protein